MSAVRTGIGAMCGALVAAVGLRAWQRARATDASLADVMTDLPTLVRDDVHRARVAAEGAWQDGREAARRAENEFDEVLWHRRRNGRTQ